MSNGCCSPNSRVIQVIEPDPTLVTGTLSGSVDPSIDESGSTTIPMGASSVMVTFIVPKISTNYRFEYLYVDAFGLVNPGDVEPVVVTQTMFGFTVQLAGLPTDSSYILRWRVVVIDMSSEIFIDAPENLRLQLPIGVTSFTAIFVNMRSNVIYGFSELRVENLADPVTTQRKILAQVAQKTHTDFTVGLSQAPDTANYFLVARTP